MKRTKAEYLQTKIGQKVLCDSCKKKKVFTASWRMTPDRAVMCPQCIQADKSSTLVSI